jgi:hypothetical protein
LLSRSPRYTFFPRADRPKSGAAPNYYQTQPYSPSNQ